ncbi:MAG: valine--tRNA ligase [Candidatus Omnitrophica bacterium]|nr:valine--tRNA ligase [Candidatus Omnitrophota bacterium]
MNEIPTRYNPKETEDKWYKFWEEKGFFAAGANPEKKPFCIVIPPPNVTGILHMGHALNNTIQDILIRYHRMKGEESLWMPGTDHAGIATQNVVEKALAKEGLKRQDLGREKFIRRVWQWKEQYGSTIIRQLKKLGASCDWQRERFTMDEGYSCAVIEVFVRLYEKGLIYRGSYIINWCPRCQTALSDEEAPHHELQGNLYYLRYPFKDNPDEYIVVATTRPETMLGDTAVAVNPKDRRYKKAIGKCLILPLINREIRVIADSMVDMEFGTGAVKVTPAHDPNDYCLAKKHNLEFVNVMHPDASMNDAAGDYRNMDRFEAREVILEDLKEKGLLEKVVPHVLSAGHCYRCHTIIEPYLSKQWFVKMKPLAKPAIDAVKKGKIRFHPGRWTKVYLNWMENIQDWCISRQIWWGHRLPVYYCSNCMKQADQSPGQRVTGSPVKNKGIIVSRSKPEKCPDCGSSDIYQDEDVLDTWFSSWLWPFATFGWPELSQDLKYFYPTAVLVTAPEIIFFWVARMIIAGFEFMGDIPFRDVYIHGTVRDIEGKKMSKSLGNIIDPLSIIDEYGADALRFSLISITAQGQDVFLSKERFEQGRNFANKIWNASRFILMNLEPEQARVDLCDYFQKEKLSLVNRWILSRFYSALKGVDQYLETFRFNEAVNTLYSFFWHEFCDWYLELIKSDIKRNENQVVMYKMLEKSLRLIQPFMPYIAEEIWQRLAHEGESIMVRPWPHVQEQLIDKKCEKEAESVFEAVTGIRNLRTSLEIRPEQRVKVSLYPHAKAKSKLLNESSGLIKDLARLESLEFLSENKRPAACVSAVSKDADIYLHFSGLLDLAAEQEKIKKKTTSLSALLRAKEARMKNAEFVKKAPKEVVEGEKESINKLNEELSRLQKMHDELR